MDKAVHPIHQVMLYLGEKHVYSRLCRRLRKRVAVCVHGQVQATTWKLHPFVLLACESLPIQEPYTEL